ncbi:MAG: peptidase S41 [Muribaculaceae bacterium]|nr:peptidase S41 [Muribaculaceae bacterium]
MKKPIILLMAVGASLLTASAAGKSDGSPMWLRDAKISPDGKNIVFTYKGDIYRVPAAGGEAVRLTTRDSYEQMPVWSPDGRKIAFASDRNGNFDIFVISSENPGAWQRLTYNSANELPESFTPDGKAVLFSASIQDPASSALYPSGRMTELYRVELSGGAPKQMLPTPVKAVSFMPDGKSFLYQDVKSFEDEFRKHHTSSATRDIWLYDRTTGKHRQLMDRPGEDLNPAAAENGDFYFLSEREGDKSINVWRSNTTDASKAERVTNFKTHPVRFLSRANNGRLAFTWDGELYTLEPGAKKPAKVAVSIDADQNEELRKLSSGSGARQPAASPDGKNVAFIYRGDVYVTSTDYKTTKQISNTAEAEGDVAWGDDTTLYYTSERDGKFNIYKATIARSDDEPSFPYATTIVEEAMFKPDGHERMMPQISPDGKSMAFIMDRTKLAVMDLKSKKVRMLTDGSTDRGRSGGFNFRWSPDSKWIAMEVIPRKHDPYADIAIMNVESGEITNLTNSGYFDLDPRWVLDGNAIIFESERYGMRNHASWGSESDVMIVFMNQKAYDDFKRDKQEAELDEAIEKLHKKKEKEKDDAEKKDDKKKDDKKNDEKSTSKDINVELAGITDRIERLTPISTRLNDKVFSADGKTLWFICRTPEGAALWSVDLLDGDVARKSKLPSGSTFFTSPDGKHLFVNGRGLNKLKDGKTTAISFEAEKLLDPAAEREFMFDNVVREEAERFYVADMHGVDWPAMTAAYRKFLPHINNNYDFAELMSEMLGELNVSHTGGRYSGGGRSYNPSRTASLGALYDLNYTGKGVKIEEILEQGPLFGKGIEAGTIIEKVNGEEILPENDLTLLLDGAAGKRTLLTLRAPGAKETTELVVKPISAGEQSELLYKRWVDARAADVDRWSNGRLGYVHISSMNDDSFRKVYSDLLGKYNDREGVVIDIRWNGGGRLHEDIEVLFSGEKYFTQEIRGDETCDMPSRRWNKPSIMVMSEACYSNAHGTPWVYKHKNIGKLVGMPVAGTMTSVNWVTMQDPTLVYGIPVIGYRLPDGSFLENQQLEPDIKVANAPESVAAGEDTQLRTAVEELLRELPAKKK